MARAAKGAPAETIIAEYQPPTKPLPHRWYIIRTGHYEERAPFWRTERFYVWLVALVAPPAMVGGLLWGLTR